MHSKVTLSAWSRDKLDFLAFRLAISVKGVRTRNLDLTKESDSTLKDMNGYFCRILSFFPSAT